MNSQSFQLPTYCVYTYISTQIGAGVHDYVYLWRAAYAPGDGQTSQAYPVNPVQYLYISCYVTANKLVLSYLWLCLLLQW
jgi:hypothetical protein